MARRSPRAFRRRSRAIRVSSRFISGPRPRQCQRSRRPPAPDRDRRVTLVAPMLELKLVRAGYGSFQALFDVSLEVRQGEAVGVIGPNGAGKTTLMRVVSGLIRPTSGSLVMDGIDLATTPSHRIVELGVAHVPESRRLFARLIVEQNVQQVLRVVDRAYLLKTGRIHVAGPSAELLASDSIREAYLGV